MAKINIWRDVKEIPARCENVLLKDIVGRHYMAFWNGTNFIQSGTNFMLYPDDAKIAYWAYMSDINSAIDCLAIAFDSLLNVQFAYCNNELSWARKAMRMVAESYDATDKIDKALIVEDD